jgi:outer membrane protein assembly factor BamB
LFYITGKNDAWSIQLNPVGDRLQPAQGSKGHFELIKEQGKTGVTATTNVAAFEPATGRLAWTATIPGATNGGNLATAGDLVFQGGGTGDVYAFDAKTGRQLFTFTSKTNGIRDSPLAYAVKGKEYVAMVGGNTILVFALP